MGCSVCLNYFNHENTQKAVENTQKREITVQTHMSTSHILPVYLTHIPKLFKFCTGDPFNSKEALLQQRPTAARLCPAPQWGLSLLPGTRNPLSSLNCCSTPANPDKAVCLMHPENRFPRNCARTNSWARHRHKLMPSQERMQCWFVCLYCRWAISTPDTWGRRERQRRFWKGRRR